MRLEKIAKMKRTCFALFATMFFLQGCGTSSFTYVSSNNNTQDDIVPAVVFSLSDLSHSDLIRAESTPYVYYYSVPADDGVSDITTKFDAIDGGDAQPKNNARKYVFPDQDGYESLYTWFGADARDRIRWISAEDIAKLPIAGNIVYRPGTFLVKIETSPKIYAVYPNALLREVLPEFAEQIYGKNWKDRVRVIPDAFFAGNYRRGGPLLRAEIPYGTVLERDSLLYYMTENACVRSFANTQAFEANNFLSEFVAHSGLSFEVCSELESLNGREEKLVDPTHGAVD